MEEKLYGSLNASNGSGKLTIYYLLAGAKTFYSTEAGTVNYDDGLITIDPIHISAISDVDGATSTKLRVTAIPASNDIIPVRNQVLEIDEVKKLIGKDSKELNNILLVNHGDEIIHRNNFVFLENK